MKFAIVTLGSAGDLHPFLAIARALVERGHEVHLLTQTPYASAVRKEGVEFSAIASQRDHDRTLGHPLLWHPLHGFGVLWRHLAVPAIGPTIEALDALSRDERLTVFASPLAVGARLARERWPDRIRLLSGYTAPMGLRSTLDPMFLGAWRVPHWLPSAARRQLWSALDRWKLQPMAQPALQPWIEWLGLTPLEGSLFGDALHSPDGGIALYPDWFAPVPADWAARGVGQTGFPVFESAQTAELPGTLAKFLGEGRPFVVVYPGSGAQCAQSFASHVMTACQDLGLRVLMLSRLSGNEPVGGSDILQLDSVPLSEVLPIASGFVHHGGIGSTAQALAARTPQLVLAAAYDQFENGARLEQMRQGHWQRITQATPESVRDPLKTFRTIHRSPALIQAPQVSRPGKPNSAVEATCEMLEGALDQFSLPGLPSRSADRVQLDRIESHERLAGYKLFVAIVPTQDLARQIAEARAVMTRQLRLKGSLLSAERLHITLNTIGGFPPGQPPTKAVVDAAVAAGDSVAWPALKLCFASAMTFPESNAFVLRCDEESDIAIANLRRTLTQAVRRVGLRPTAAGTPHMTLLYDRRYLPEHEIEPLGWTARRFALILSHVGRHHHQRICEWSSNH